MVVKKHQSAADVIRGGRNDVEQNSGLASIKQKNMFGALNLGNKMGEHFLKQLRAKGRQLGSLPGRDNNGGLEKLSMYIQIDSFGPKTKKLPLKSRVPKRFANRATFQPKETEEKAPE